MSTAKEEVRKMLDQLPDDLSFEDIQYHIYVREKIEHGLQDIETGRLLPQEEVERRMGWLMSRSCSSVLPMCVIKFGTSNVLRRG